MCLGKDKAEVDFSLLGLLETPWYDCRALFVENISYSLAFPLKK